MVELLFYFSTPFIIMYWINVFKAFENIFKLYYLIVVLFLLYQKGKTLCLLTHLHTYVSNTNTYIYTFCIKRSTRVILIYLIFNANEGESLYIFILCEHCMFGGGYISHSYYLNTLTHLYITTIHMYVNISLSIQMILCSHLFSHWKG